MKLKSFGCSFIWGSEMRDALYHPRYPSRTTWPSLLARHLGLEYECYACPGAGNLQIADQILNHAAAEPAMFVVNWTYIDRFDFGDPTVFTQRISSWYTLRPSGSEQEHAESADFYYRNLQSDYRDKLTTLINIKVCIDQLTQAGHDFIMTYADNLMLDSSCHISRSIQQLQNNIVPHLCSFDGTNMLEYSRRRGHPIGANNHPLEAAHRDLFDYARSNFLVDKIKTS